MEIINIRQESVNKKVYQIINTTDYPCDGYGIIVIEIDDKFDIFEKYGFDINEINRIKELNVSGILQDFDYDGVIVIRMA